jgi:hypothetical protein
MISMVLTKFTSKAVAFEVWIEEQMVEKMAGEVESDWQREKRERRRERVSSIIVELSLKEEKT